MFGNFTADEFDVFMQFGKEADKAFEWNDVYRFLYEARQDNILDWRKKDDLDLVVRYLREFGITATPRLFAQMKILFERNEIPEELRALGLRSTGAQGVNELRRVVRGIRSSLISKDTVEHVDNPVIQEIAAIIIRFHVSQWKRQNLSIGDMLSRVREGCEDGSIQDVPEEYTEGKMDVAKLDQEKMAEFHFSEGFVNRFRQLAEAFEYVRDKKELQEVFPRVREQLMKTIDTHIDQTEARMIAMKAEGKPAQALAAIERSINDFRFLRSQGMETKDVRVLVSSLLQYDKKENPVTTQAIRQLLLLFAQKENAEYRLDSLASPSREGVQQMMVYIEDLLFAEALPKLDVDRT